MSEPEEVLDALAGYSLQWEVWSESGLASSTWRSKSAFVSPQKADVDAILQLCRDQRPHYFLCIRLFAPRYQMLDLAVIRLSGAIRTNRGSLSYRGAYGGAEYVDGIEQLVDLTIPATNGVEARAWVARRLGVQEAKPRGRR